MQALLTSLFVLLLGACASNPYRDAMKIQPGMSKDEVTALAGPPLDRAFVGSQERWVYGKEEGDTARKVIVFRNGKVVSLESEVEAGTGAGASANANKGVIPATGPIPDLPCSDRNNFGSFAEGGGCNMYGCFPPGGYCNSFGCSAHGVCTVKKCPRAIETYRCVE